MPSGGAPCSGALSARSAAARAAAAAAGGFSACGRVALVQLVRRPLGPWPRRPGGRSSAAGAPAGGRVSSNPTTDRSSGTRSPSSAAPQHPDATTSEKHSTAVGRLAVAQQLRARRARRPRRCVVRSTGTMTSRRCRRGSRASSQPSRRCAGGWPVPRSAVRSSTAGVPSRVRRCRSAGDRDPPGAGPRPGRRPVVDVDAGDARRRDPGRRTRVAAGAAPASPAGRLGPARVDDRAVHGDVAGRTTSPRPLG